MPDQPAKTNRPPDDAFRQQKLKAWQPIMTPWKVIALFAAIGVIFIPTGTKLLSDSNAVYEDTYEYDSDTAPCTISSQNQGRVCDFSFTLKDKVDGPLYVYYQLGNFYQNHRRYVSSVDYYQLEGQSQSASSLDTTCVESVKNGSRTLNPCGLIANSFFTDIISLYDSTPSGFTLDESNIAWPSDKYKFSQPQGFKYKIVNSKFITCSEVDLPNTCKQYYNSDTNTTYLYYYPNEDKVQYLYQTFPDQISPIDGVNNEHFQVWMRPAALPNFRKLYGKIDGTFNKGDVLTFRIICNYEVNSFSGSKSLQISTIGLLGGSNPYLGVAYIVVGALALLFGLLFAAKQLIAPRPFADISLLNWE